MVLSQGGQRRTALCLVHASQLGGPAELNGRCAVEAAVGQALTDLEARGQIVGREIRKPLESRAARAAVPGRELGSGELLIELTGERGVLLGAPGGRRARVEPRERKRGAEPEWRGTACFVCSTTL